MGKRISLFLAAMLALAVLGPAVSVHAENAPYVDAAIADNEFSHITAQDMEVIRTKKILLVGYSGSLDMRDGLRSLACGNNMYCILPGCCAYSSADYSIREKDIIPADAFSSQNVVHIIGPNDGALAPGNTSMLVREIFPPDVIDVVMIFGDAAWADYDTVMDELRADFPNIKFIYSTPSYKYVTADEAEAQDRANYIDARRLKYKNVVPLYDLAALVSDNGRCGIRMCEEYSTDGIHYNTDAIKPRLGKAFLVMLDKLFADATSTDTQAPTAPTSLIAAAVSSSRIDLSWTASTDNVGVTGYRVERCSGSTCTNFVQIGTPADITFSNTGLTSSTTYRYRVRAADAAGNLSGYSNIAASTTQAASQEPVAWWKFDETSGNTASDSSGNGNTGTLVNVPVWTAGKLGNALSFDGVDDYVALPNIASTAQTISAWIKPYSYAAGTSPDWTDAILYKGSDSQNGFFGLQHASNGVFGGARSSASGKVFADIAAAPLNEWTHVAAVLDGPNNTLTIYRNGTFGSQTSVSGFSSNSNAWNVGRHPIGGTYGYYFNGLIDDVRIYNRVLSAQEIQSLYQAGSSIHKSDTDQNGCVSNTELSDFISFWYVDSSNPTLKELMEAIGFWKRGC